MPITALPTPPSRQDPANFSSRADAFLGALPAFATEANALQTAVNGSETNAAASAGAAAVSANNANNSALAAATSATQLLAAANYKGHWSGLAGALNIPASVTHSGKFWLLNTNTANVAADTPGVSSKWTELVVLQAKQIFSDTSAFTAVSEGETVTKYVVPTGGNSSGRHLCFKVGTNYVVVPYNTNGSVYWTSSDCITWTQRAFPGNVVVTGGVVNGSSIFLTQSGNNILSSTDSGVTFSNNVAALANPPLALGGIGQVGGTYFCLQPVNAATATFQTSANGTSWSNGGTNPLPVPGSSGSQINFTAACYVSSSTTVVVTGNANGAATTAAATATSPGGNYTARTLALSGTQVKLITNGSGTVVSIVNGNSAVNYSSDSGANWSNVAAGMPTNMNGGCYQSTGTVWMACGDGPSIYTTTTPGSGAWTSRTSNSPSALKAMGSSGSASVAVGNNGAVVTSPDGTTWTNRTATSNTSNTLLDVAYNGSTMWCAVGAAGTIITSTDGGVNWTVRTSGTTNNLRAVIFANSRWVVVGDSGTVLTSTDGITWTQQTRLTDRTLYTVVYTGSVFVVTGDQSLLMVSTDGTATAFTAVLNTNLHASSMYVGKKRVGGLAWIWYRGSAFYWTSSNGTTWTARCAPGTIGGFGSTVPQVHPDGGLRGMSADKQSVYETTNGTSWSTLPAIIPQFWASTAQPAPIKLNGTWMLAEYSNATYQGLGLFTTATLNGVNWSRRQLQTVRTNWIDCLDDEYCWELDQSVSPPRGMFGGTSNNSGAFQTLLGGTTGYFA